MSQITPEKEAQQAEIAKRALQEAADRKAKAGEFTLPSEVGGRDGPDPIRYGDWEKKGIASDF